MQSFSNLLPFANSQHHHHHHGRHVGLHHPPQLVHQNGFRTGTPPSNLSIESCPETPSRDLLEPTPFCSSPKTEYSSSPKSLQKSHNHHHHSIQELIRHFGKKVHNWRSSESYRRNSCSEDNSPTESDFRGRSKSLDCHVRRPNVSDCEATYRIYNTILKEGMFMVT